MTSDNLLEAIEDAASHYPQASNSCAELLQQFPSSHPERLAFLHQLLGEPACRQRGIYPIPDGFKLSVVIPVYNEERWIQ